LTLIRDWFARRPCWHIHFTPTSASWINQVERFFALLTDKQIRRGVHSSTQALEADIHVYIGAHNAEPKPFRWTKSADDISSPPSTASASALSKSMPAARHRIGTLATSPPREPGPYCRRRDAASEPLPTSRA
jgi:hypothetical protein